MSKNREFYWRRLHSLLGIIPVGLFLMVHLVVNHFATRGADAFNNASNFMESLPFLLIMEIFIIYLPLLFHAFYGIYIAFTAKNNPKNFGTLRNYLFILQRFTGIFLVVFIAWHVFETKIQTAIAGDEVNFDMMANILSNPWMFGFYIVGIVAATFHLANGIWSFLVSWGFTQSPKSQQIVTYVTLVIFLALSVVGVQALLAFR
ncbi:succinate dehydrogenase [Psychrobacillus glaciei]|uniref:Succinate dehydrogenase n=1 Tax=Psychrobacillus glaciei TaxID=2283160 RepID=A0A5J6STQ2_9BACI|nr:succinate dehydrogenase cytochrome b558 subunit [Psychrobacillus glaciei]QFF99617.1 succinate dehydrogenase [Psychrobacillus glaciei]